MARRRCPHCGYPLHEPPPIRFERGEVFRAAGQAYMGALSKAIILGACVFGSLALFIGLWVVIALIGKMNMPP